MNLIGYGGASGGLCGHAESQGHDSMEATMEIIWIVSKSLQNIFVSFHVAVLCYASANHQKSARVSQ